MYKILYFYKSFKKKKKSDNNDVIEQLLGKSILRENLLQELSAFLKQC